MDYKVKSLFLGGLGNRIFKCGDIVNEANFPEGNVPELVKQGFLESTEEKKESVISDKKKKGK